MVLRLYHLKKFRFIEKLQKTTLETTGYYSEDRVGMNMNKEIVDKDLCLPEDKAKTATVACSVAINALLLAFLEGTPKSAL